jgi:hypothetical protein
LSGAFGRIGTNAGVTGWEQLPKRKLYGEFGLVQLVN